MREGQLGRVSTDNPEGRFDWYVIGGRWDKSLKLLKPKEERRAFGHLPPRIITQTNAALKLEIDQPHLLLDPPAHLVSAGQWFSSPMFAKGEVREQWKRQFAEIFRTIPENTQLTAVDVHS